MIVLTQPQSDADLVRLLSTYFWPHPDQGTTLTKLLLPMVRAWHPGSDGRAEARVRDIVRRIGCALLGIAPLPPGWSEVDVNWWASGQHPDVLRQHLREAVTTIAAQDAVVRPVAADPAGPKQSNSLITGYAQTNGG